MKKGLRQAYVLNTRANGLGTCRSLAMMGVPVVAVDFHEDAMGLRSRCFQSHVRVPNVEVEPDAAVDALLAIQAKHGGKGVLFPASDAFVLWMSRYRRRLTEQFDMALAPEEVLEGILDKKRQYASARRLGIPIPETFFPQSIEDLDEFKEDIRYPVLIKPTYSHKWQQVFENKGFQVFDPAELEARMSEVLDQDLGTDIMVQRVIQGPSSNYHSCRAYIDRRGEARGVHEVQKLRQYPADFGIGTLVRSTRNDEVRELGLSFMKGLGHRGLGSVEFKFDPIDGSYRLMELNSRSVKTNLLSIGAGVNLPWLMYQDLTGSELDNDGPWKEGVRWHDFMNDCRSYMTLRARGEVTFKEWMRSSLGAERRPYFDWHDLGTCVHETKWGLRPAREFIYVLIFNAGQLIRGSGRVR